ncbi:MAG TPA: T9SS type A sorting domain-containing protein [Bacteroidales bacterium]|nr:T9SS type A sorting domain-containing protein [Bacteroidales bacterium]
MKKIISILLCSLISLVSGLILANPVELPTVWLYRLSFDAQQQWKMKLGVQGSFDSVLISSSSGRSKYLFDEALYNDFKLITADSLDNPVNINPAGDSVTIITWFKKWNKEQQDTLTETVIFGDYPNATLPAPGEGQSIGALFPEYLWNKYHCLFEEATPLKGAVHGYIYDMDNNPVTGGMFNFSPYPVGVACMEEGYFSDGFKVNADGSYSINLYSAFYKTNLIWLCDRDELYNTCFHYFVIDTLQIEPLDLTVLPDTDVEQNIYLNEVINDIPQTRHGAGNLFKIFPNPLQESTLRYEVAVPVKSTRAYVELYSAEGKMVQQYRIQDNSGELPMPSKLNKGVYLLRFRLNGKIRQVLQLVKQ